jgi:phosphoglucosamine mutase
MSRKLFGTDGIRGKAGEFPLDRKTVYAAGAALGQWAKSHDENPQVLIGMDTRESGPWIAACLAGGLAAAGVGARFAGVITTPGVAYLTRTGPFVAGVMISASHNPFEDNGIKVFSHSGYKLPDAEELGLETEIFRQIENGVAPVEARLPAEHQLDTAYADYLASTLVEGCGPLKIIVDCGNGAAAELAPALLERLGAKVEKTGCAPDGRNINKDCGSLHVEALAQLVVKNGADLGCAFDGDADRCILVSSSGRIVDGDMVLLACSRFLAAQNKLAGSLVVATVMSNLGLERALAASGLGMLRTPVGDKYVLEEMIRRGASIGGEQSGHVIFREYATTGDGILTAVRVLEVMRKTGKPLDELVADFVSYPQTLVNIRVKSKRPLEEMPAVQALIAEVEKSLGGEGRVLVRFSGTELLARVMVEGPTQQAVDAHAGRIAAQIQAELG